MHLDYWASNPLTMREKYFSEVMHNRGKASLNGSFMEGFKTLNTIIFADMEKKENDEVL